MIWILNVLFNNNILKKLIYFVLRSINRLIPKKSNQILFASIPDFSDNSKVFFEYCYKNNIASKYQLLWTVNHNYMVEELKQMGIRVYLQKSIIGLYQFFRSKYLIVTHNDYGGLKSSNQVLINLWHGIPLKAMGFVDSSETESSLSDLKRGSKAIDILITTSVVARNSLVTCFLTDPRKVYITGQPRNDKLFLDTSKEKFMKLFGSDISEYKKIILFIPTFRVSDHKVEGVPVKDNIFNFCDFNSNYFCNFLKLNNLLFIMKFHPNEENLFSSKFGIDNNLQNIFLLKTKLLQDNFLDLYDILGAIDILITDYSSVYFDFLLLNKPIIFTPIDLMQYSQSRGLVLEPYEFWTPGPKVLNFHNFLDELRKCIEDPQYYENERKTITKIIYKYNDGNSCERVWKTIRNLHTNAR